MRKPKSTGRPPAKGKPFKGKGDRAFTRTIKKDRGDEKDSPRNAKQGNERRSKSGFRPGKNTFSSKPDSNRANEEKSERSSPFSERRSKDRSARGGAEQERRPESGRKRKNSFEPGIKKERTGGSRPGFRERFDSRERKYRSEQFGGENTGREQKRKEEGNEGPKRVKFDDFEEGRVFSNSERPKRNKDKTKFKKSTVKSKPQAGEGLVRLNKYLSNAGIASRREADTLIQSGVVKVNGVVIDQLGYKINPGDKVTYGDAPVRGERKVYLLLNKPKDYITTVDDPQERKTVMELVSKACRERIYPVGRLDRNTTGLLLFTNDGELTTRLTHPKFGVRKVYHVSLNKGLKPEDFKAISEGIELEDGPVKVDDLAFVGEGKKEIGIEIHSGRNRIVRRIFEQLGYDVIKLDRVVFAGLTKKDLPRGKHRFLTAKEISFLQMIG